MTCSRCGAAIHTQAQFDRGLCASCLTGSSLSALVGLAASHRLDAVSGGEVGKVTFETRTVFQPPVYFGIPRADFEGLPKEWPADTPWKPATPAANRSDSPFSNRFEVQ